MKKFTQAISAKYIASSCAVKDVLKNKRAASLWEYLLVIAVVCVVGALVIGVITGENGLKSIWEGLIGKFTGLINTTV